MEVKETPAAALRRPAPNPKALIHEKYGTQACYFVEEVQQSVDSVCPGLVIAQKSQILYRCCLALPELSVTSDTFTRKKDAEQSAAKMAVEKLGIQSASTDLTPQDAWNELVARLSFFFSEKFLSSSHPLVGHFRALERVQDLHSMIPFSAIVACDAKVNSLCKIIDPKTESDPILVSSVIWKAARTCDSLCTSTGGGFWVGPEALQLLTNRALGLVDPVKVEALHIPCSIEGDIESLSLNVSDNQYYMDEIAQKLGARDASHILVSRTIGKASSEMKLYFPIPEVAHGSSNSSGDLLSDVEGNASLKSRQNKRASYLSGQNIYGDSILANVGYTRKSSDLFFEDISPCSYYRMILGKVPDGQYKLSREAILAAQLPNSFTTRSNWKGPFPRDLLCVFCRQHRLLEPIFSVKTIDSSETLQSEACKNMKTPRLCEDGKITNGCVPTAAAAAAAAAATARELDNSSAFKCDLKILSRKHDIILECSSDKIYRKESDSIQNTSLKVLTWLKKYFMQLDMPVEKLPSFGLDHNIIIYPVNFSREFTMSKSIYGAKENSNIRKCYFLRSNCVDQPDLKHENGMIFVNADSEDSGAFPSPGSLACINYVVTLTQEGDPRKELIERRDDFEFEIGTGSVINQLEACVTQMSVNETTVFVTTLPSRDLLLAASADCIRIPTQLFLSNCFLEYSIKVLRVTEALEDRMEQALFSPSLSKQRVQFAVRHINDSHLTSLVDFGCGSGSLLDSLLEHSTTLETMAGVDISRKGLTRAAKIIHSKMSKSSCQESIKSAVLYDGSIMDFDSRLYGFDIGTCLEVIEHMEEDQACLFGDVVLSSFCPRVLIVSTPNYEYNRLLQKLSFPNKEEDSEERLSACKFRNYDHKFEWTRKQFEQWATDLAVRHNYSVEFSGVGGSGDMEPGFASQIAVFRSRLHGAEKKCSRDEDQSHPYEVIWEWNNRSSSAV